jgi:uncharacterized membrane protein
MLPMALWLIPMLYVAGTLCFGIVFLRLEHEYLVQHKINLSQWFFNDFSIASAQACLGAIASGMIALTAIVFTVAYITALIHRAWRHFSLASLCFSTPLDFSTPRSSIP